MPFILHHAKFLAKKMPPVLLNGLKHKMHLNTLYHQFLQGHSITKSKTSRLQLHSQTIAVCSPDRFELINTLCGHNAEDL
jgi:hypothetical protein